MAIGDEIFEIREDVLLNSGVFLKYDQEMAILKA
jgi:hypothetical protein